MLQEADPSALRLAVVPLVPPRIRPSSPQTLQLDPTVIELLIVTGFAEVWLAREEHSGAIFMNLLIEPTEIEVRIERTVQPHNFWVGRSDVYDLEIRKTADA
jgi:hypothetical protein